MIESLQKLLEKLFSVHMENKKLIRRPTDFLFG